MQVTNFCCNRYFLVERKTKKIGHRHGGGITLYLSFSLTARNSEPLQLEMQNLIMSNILNLPTLFMLKFTNMQMILSLNFIITDLGPGTSYSDLVFEVFFSPYRNSLG
jgi:hypothetical protein